MLNRFFSFMLFILLLNFTFQQTINPVPQTPLNKTVDPFQKFNDILLRNLEGEQELPNNTSTEIIEKMENKLQIQIIIWTSISLAFILYFIVMALIDMPNPKSSILYAKYDTTRSENEL